MAVAHEVGRSVRDVRVDRAVRETAGRPGGAGDVADPVGPGMPGEPEAAAAAGADVDPGRPHARRRDRPVPAEGAVSRATVDPIAGRRPRAWRRRVKRTGATTAADGTRVTTVVLPRRRSAPRSAAAAIAVAGVTTVVPTGDLDRTPVRRATWPSGPAGWASPAAVAEALRVARRDLSVVAALLVAVGVVFGAVGLPAALVVRTVVVQERFVATFSGLSADRDVRDLVERSTVSAVEQYLPVPRGSEDSADASVRRATRAVLHGAGWPSMWDGMVRSAHRETLAALRSDPVALGRADRDGGIGIRITPAVAAVRERLIAAGVPNAGVVPAVDRTVVLVDAGALGTARTAWRWLAVIGSASPWVGALMIGLGVAFSRHRWRTLTVAAFAFLVAVTVADGVVNGVRDALLDTAPSKEVADAVTVVVGTASSQLGVLVLVAAAAAGAVGVVSLVVTVARARVRRRRETTA